MVVGDGILGHRQSRSPENVTSPQPPASSPSPSDNTRNLANVPLADGSYLDDHRVHMAAEVALGALSTLPTPILVLSSSKNVLLANYAVGRLLGVDQDDVGSNATAQLKGQTLSQLGIDLLDDGVPIWVSWEKFLDNLVDGLQPAKENATSSRPPLLSVAREETTPVAISEADRGRSPSRTRPHIYPDTVVDVVISSQRDRSAQRVHRKKQTRPQQQLGTTCRMIISIWNLERQTFFTLTFTSSASPSSGSSKVPSISSSSQRHHSSHSTRSSHSTHSQTPTSSATSQITSPSEQPNGVSFPSFAPPPQSATSSTLTDFQKVLKMKNAMLRAVEIPLIAMWRDESVVFPNQAARKLLAVDSDPTNENSYDFKSRFKPWAADFSHELEDDTNPIVALCRTQQGFTNWQIGLLDERTGKKFNFDVSGHPVNDEKTGEFLAGLIAFKDVTEYTAQIAHQAAESDAEFRLICDAAPQMIWTTRPDGYHDYYSQRWYDYTGLTPANCIGHGWKLPFHDDDMPEATRRWMHSLATGDEYITEYRCRRYDGEWRWMLGRALPFRDHKTNKILKWFGSCTDIQEIVDAKIAGQRSRQQLLGLLKNSEMTLWILDRDWNVNFYEGTFVMGDSVHERGVVGSSILDVVGGYLVPQAMDHFKDTLRRILAGTSDLEILENQVNSRWFRHKLVPLKGETGPDGATGANDITGVIIIGSDVTGMRRKEQENITLLANETAAKEASKMKSSFLANMSHEIRTPIAGVLGMSELLMDTKLDEEQSDFAQNIQRSANSLLTVINDILDFSKIESGRLDIEEVQFSLGVVLRDVAKMLSYAAERKGLQFSSDFRLGPAGDLILLGDPGRIRQILVNLLTNSIKFTSEGSVRMTSDIIGETSDTATVEFCVEDSGIGIEEDVKKRLFRPFSQADSSTARRFGGTGLGLTISKNLVDLMRGTIRLDSKLDSGTRATFTIPFQKVEYQGTSTTALPEVGSMPDRLQSDLSISMAGSPHPGSHTKTGRSASALMSPAARSIDSRRVSVEKLATVPAQQSPEPELQRENIHILVVEDNPVNQQIALKFIQSLKFSATAVWNGREALEYLLKATSPDFTPEQARDYPIPSLILMDVQMPVLDGYHATHLLRHHHPYSKNAIIPHIPIVAMTASAIHGDREKCEKAGMDDYMAKPVKRSLLELMILKWVSKGRGDQTPRSTSDINAGFEKLSLQRSRTDHSSSCSHNDTIAAEFYAVQVQSEPIAIAAEHDADDSLYANGQDAARRSGISKAILEIAIPGGESAGDVLIRRAEAVDKASDLRDAKLLSATESVRGISADTPKLIINGNLSTKSSPLILQESNPVGGTSPMALTEENMSRFNYTQHGSPEPSRTPSPGAGSEQLSLDIPGPPPHLAHVETSEALISSILENAKVTRRPTVQRAASSDTPRRLGPNRRDVGGLTPESRQKSDWSTSTARPIEKQR